MNTLFNRSEKLDSWYEKNLHLNRADTGGFVGEHIEMMDGENAQMLSFKVHHLAPLIQNLAESGIRIVDHIDENSKGRFAWFYDPEGNKIEVWEPWDESLSVIDLPEPD
ncbi:VOC family protein [Bdellovibrio sp. HCB288]|uniref:VOC family protein n=1 Tax=Bdellovibrio sp. HCB288 TaxID=3394355 RepID=UPI0039B58718